MKVDIKAKTLMTVAVLLFLVPIVKGVISQFVSVSGNATVTAAPEVLQQSWLEGNTTSCTGTFHNCDNEHLDKNLTQSFKPSKSGLITKVSLFLARHSNNTAAGNITVQIRTNTNSTCKSGSTNCPNSTVLATGTIQDFNGNNDNYVWKNVTFASPVMLTVNQTYHIVTSDVGSDLYRWAKDKDAPVYSNGQRGKISGSVWEMKSNEAHIFEVFMKVGP